MIKDRAASPTSLNSWNDEDKPRERIVRNGVRSVSDVELVAVMLGVGTTKKNVMELSQEIIDYVDGDLCRLSDFGIDDFISAFKGVGRAQAIKLVASLEFGRRRSEYRRDNKPKVITNSKNVVDLFYDEVLDQNTERMLVALLNRSNRVIKSCKVGEGTAVGVLVDVKEVVRLAIMHGASGMILCHNHPSGSPRPSAQDRALTEKIAKAAKLFDIALLDHVIITDNPSVYHSFADEGEM